MSVLILILVVFLFLGVIKAGLRLAWGLTKFLFGLGLFWLCPVLFAAAVLLGAFSGYWIWIVLIALLCGWGFRRG